MSTYSAGFIALPSNPRAGDVTGRCCILCAAILGGALEEIFEARGTRRANHVMITSRLLVVYVAVALASFASGVGAADPGKEKSAACAACHGADGNSPNAVWPNLAGQHADYIVKQLKAYKSGERQEPSMTPMAAPLSEQDMYDIAHYYAAQKPSVGIADETLVTAGRAIFRGGNMATGVPACMACHGPRGAGTPGAGYPALSGQHSEYTVKQLEAYRRGERVTDADLGAVMRTIASRMSDAEIKASASYAAGLY
jgi:cytochrome c553